MSKPPSAMNTMRPAASCCGPRRRSGTRWLRRAPFYAQPGRSLDDAVNRHSPSDTDHPLGDAAAMDGAMALAIPKEWLGLKINGYLSRNSVVLPSGLRAHSSICSGVRVAEEVRILLALRAISLVSLAI